MNTKAFVTAGLIVIIVGGAYRYFDTKSSPPPIPGSEPTPTYTTSMEKIQESRYTEYSKNAFAAAKGKKRVMFFHASWCPTCKAANGEFSGNPDGIPEDVVLFKTDYDKEAELKKQHGITYQHTFVLVDENGKELKKWNGGGLTELAANTK